MKFFGEVKGGKAIRAALSRSGNEVYKAAVEQLKESTLAIHENAIRLIQENSDGKAQLRYDPTRVVKVSQPGDPPNTDTGTLVKSIGFEFSIGKLGGKLTSRVGTNLKYGAWLEFGTKNMAARPWLSRAIEFEAELVKENFETRINDTISGLGVS